MRYFPLILLVILSIISACSRVATPLPPPTFTDAPLPTDTVSSDEMTAAVSFQVTLPASFTPTFTPSVTATATATFTPTATDTPTTIPDDFLCESFRITNSIIGDSMPVSQLGDVVQFFVPYDDVSILLEVIELETGEVIESGTLPGNNPWTLDFRAENFPTVGEYEWVVSLSYNNRDGLCEQRGTFDTTPQDLGTPIDTGEATAEVTAEMTVEVTESATPIRPVMATEAMTGDTPANNFQFPPR